jgi:type I restriction enzyme S subunit
MNLNQYSVSAAQPGLSVELVSNLLIPLPPPDEQQAIATFLDRETAKIDALIAEQERLIELLTEKRQATIAHAVTKGLNKYTPMKDSGVEWLGAVPVHWKSGALRWYAKCGSGTGISTDDVQELRSDEHSVPVIGGNGLMGFTAKSGLDQTVIAVGRVGALCGNVHIVPSPSWITDNALVVRPDQSQFRLPYLEAVLRARSLNEIAAKTAQPLITGTQVMDQRLPMPPLSEQDEIVNFIQAHAAACDALIEEARSGSRLLQERRSALISAAVTGKIDVRNLVEATA